MDPEEAAESPPKEGEGGRTSSQEELAEPLHRHLATEAEEQRAGRGRPVTTEATPLQRLDSLLAQLRRHARHVGAQRAQQVLDERARARVELHDAAGPRLVGRREHVLAVEEAA